MARFSISVSKLKLGSILLLSLFLCLCLISSLAYADESTTANEATAAQTLQGKWQKTAKGWQYIVSDAPAKGFIKDNGKTYYLDSSTGIMKTGWQLIQNTWYYFDASGAMKTGWLKKGAWYYLSPSDGKMLTGKQTIDKQIYFLASSGAMKTGWNKENGDWYYYATSGAMKTGWQKSAGKWYYLDSSQSGKMRTGKYKVGSSYYISNSNGAMYASSWVKLAEGWYYATASGALKSGWLKSGSKWYWLQSDKQGLMLANTKQDIQGSLYSFTSDGAMQSNCQVKLDNNACGYASSSGAITTIGTFDGSKVILKNSAGKVLTGWQKLAGKWFYGDSKGVMQTGWLQLGDKWYWLASDGVMAANAWVDGGKYYVGSDGVWVQATIIRDIRSQFAHGTKTAKYQKYIVIHDTEGGGTPQNVVAGWASNGQRVASHFVIGKDGTIVQCVELDRIAHHVGFAPRGSNSKFGVPEDGRDDRIGTQSIGSYSPDYGMNSYSIGIELIHQGSSGESYPAAQLNALDKVISYIDTYYGFKSTIIDHKMWNGNSDTSKEFSWYLSNYRDHRTHN